MSQVHRVLLASDSPRRLELLRAAGVDVQVRSAPCDERPRPGEPATAYTRRLAAQKLDAARAAHDTASGGGIWLAADTAVWFPPEGPPLGKPADRAEARLYIRRLTEGAPHEVTTGWALAVGRATPHVQHSSTRVWMRSLMQSEIEPYLASDEWTDKAGGYAIQGTAASWVTRIEGSYSNVVGLPVAQVIEHILQLEAP